MSDFRRTALIRASGTYRSFDAHVNATLGAGLAICEGLGAIEGLLIEQREAAELRHAELLGSLETLREEVRAARPGGET